MAAWHSEFEVHVDALRERPADEPILDSLEHVFGGIAASIADQPDAARGPGRPPVDQPRAGAAPVGPPRRGDPHGHRRRGSPDGHRSRDRHLPAHGDRGRPISADRHLRSSSPRRGARRARSGCASSTSVSSCSAPAWCASRGCACSDERRPGPEPGHLPATLVHPVPSADRCRRVLRRARERSYHSRPGASTWQSCSTGSAGSPRDDASSWWRPGWPSSRSPFGAFTIGGSAPAGEISIPGTPTAQVTDRLAAMLPDASGGSGTVVFAHRRRHARSRTPRRRRSRGLVAQAATVDGVRQRHRSVRRPRPSATARPARSRTGGPDRGGAGRISSTGSASSTRARRSSSTARPRSTQGRRSSSTARRSWTRRRRRSPRNQAKIDAGLVKIAAGQAKLDAGRTELADGQRKLNAGKAVIATNQAKLEPRVGS